jgi:hypothetical protein
MTPTRPWPGRGKEAAAASAGRLLAVSLNLVGDALRDLLDPRNG